MKRELTIALAPDWKAKRRKAGEVMQRGIDTGAYRGERLNAVCLDRVAQPTVISTACGINERH